MGIFASKILSDEEAARWLEDLERWKAGQPEYITVEMTNEEIMRICVTVQSGKGKLERFSFVQFSGEKYRYINGKLYKKVLKRKIICERGYPVGIKNTDFYIPSESGAALCAMITRDCDVPLELWNKCGSLAKINYDWPFGDYKIEIILWYN